MKDFVERVFLSSFGADNLNMNDISLFYDNVVLRQIITKAEASKKMPFVAKYFQTRGIEINYWTKILNKYHSRNQHILEKTCEVFNQFHIDELKKVFLYENFGALLLSNSDLSQFSSSDIDIYVDPTEKGKLYYSLSKLGFHCNKEESKAVTSVFIKEDEIFKINVMWQPLSRDKLPFLIDTVNLMQCDNLVIYKGTKIIIPNPTILMYLCLLHISVHCYVREPDLRLYKDIEFLSKMQIDWNRIYEFSRNDKKIIRVMTALYISKNYLNIDVPINDEFCDRVSVKSQKKIIGLITDSKTKKLRFNLSKVDVLKIEIYSDCPSFFIGLINMFFPNIKWLKQTYSNKLNLIVISYAKYLMNLLK